MRVGMPEQFRVSVGESDAKQGGEDRQDAGMWKSAASLNVLVVVDIEVAEVVSDIALAEATLPAHAAPFVGIEARRLRC